jgi:pseudouridine synthase
MSKRIRLLTLMMRTGEFERSHEAEQAIKQGLVSVDGMVAVDPKYSVKVRAKIVFGGRELKPRPLTYIILNKEKGMVCQKSAKEASVYDVIKGIGEIDEKTRRSLFTVGRLDKDSEGLLVVTNDGQVEKLLTRGRILKTYSVETKEPATEEQVEKLREGVEIKDEDTGRVFFVKAVSAIRGERLIEIGIEEGRKRQIKKMLKAVGNEVVGIKRIGIGRLRLEDLKGRAYMIVKKVVV